MRRLGHTYRIHDVGPFTAAFCGSYRCDGSHRTPTIDLIFRDRIFSGRSCTGGRALKYRRTAIRLPHFTFARAYQLRRIPGVWLVYRMNTRVLRWVSS